MVHISHSWQTPARKPRTKKDMREYLLKHPRYNTMNSWNNATSYARSIKLQRLSFPDKATENVAYDIVGSDSDWWRDAGISEVINDFAERYDHQWQIGSNGRSGGYLVLYMGGTKPSGYRSYCQCCGQQNYATVLAPLPENPTPIQLLERYWLAHPIWTATTYPEQSEVKALGLPDAIVVEEIVKLRHKYGNHPNVTETNRCGRCNKMARVNYVQEPVTIFSCPGKDVDMHEDFESWTKSDLEARVSLVWDFDKTVDNAVAMFIDYCKDHKVVEREVRVPKTVRVVVAK